MAWYKSSSDENMSHESLQATSMELKIVFQKPKWHTKGTQWGPITNIEDGQGEF